MRFRGSLFLRPWPDSASHGRSHSNSPATSSGGSNPTASDDPPIEAQLTGAVSSNDFAGSIYHRVQLSVLSMRTSTTSGSPGPVGKLIVDTVRHFPVLSSRTSTRSPSGDPAITA